MMLPALIKHLAFFLALTVISVLITRLMISRVFILDNPNERSSHTAPVPRSGGLAIVATFFMGLIVIACASDIVPTRQLYFYSFVASALLIAVISLYDDIRSISYAVRLSIQILAVFIVLASGLAVHAIQLPGLGTLTSPWIMYPVTFLWIVGMTNAFNFMDGLDGLAGGVALIVSCFFCLITWMQGSHFVYILSYIIIAGTLGFLIFNFPPARIFMGDVGSAFLGFTFAVMAIIAAYYDHSQTPILVMPLLLFNFIYDTVFTLLRRLIRGENVAQAHRTHLYQLLQQLGYSHLAVSLFHYVLFLLQGIAATIMVTIPTNEQRLWFFLPFLAIHVVYSWMVVRGARRAGILSSDIETP